MTTQSITEITINSPFVFEDYEPGDRVYLVSWFNESQPKQEYYQLNSETPITNRGEEKPEGWLGSTDGINKTSHGLYEIESLELVRRLSKEPIAGKRRPEPVATKVVLSRV